MFTFIGHSFQFITVVLNALCLLFAGFRSYQCLQIFLRRGEEEDDGRLPTFPEFVDFEDDRDEKEKEKEEKIKKNQPFIKLTSWMHYWTIFALLRTLEVNVSAQFATIQLFLNVTVLSNQQLGPKLTETLFEVAIQPLFQIIDANLAPKGQKFARFFHTSFAQTIRGIHTHLIMMSVPNASDELLDELVLHVINVKKIISKEKRRREVEELSRGNIYCSNNSSSNNAKENNRPRTATKKSLFDGLRKRKGMRQSLGLF